MAKTFSDMTELERRVNRALLRAGLAADFVERTNDVPMSYDDAGVRRAMRMAADEVKSDLLDREKALRAVQKALPALHCEDAKSAKDVYLMALQELGAKDMDDLKRLDAAGLAGVFRVAAESANYGARDELSPRLRARMDAGGEEFSKRYGVARPKRLM